MGSVSRRASARTWPRASTAACSLLERPPSGSATRPCMGPTSPACAPPVKCCSGPRAWRAL